jgi:hypothetical protein
MVALLSTQLRFTIKSKEQIEKRKKKCKKKISGKTEEIRETFSWKN